MISLERLLDNKKVLIIDDLPEARQALKKMICEFGGSLVHTANDGRSGSERLQNRHYDIVFVDYHLKYGKNGQQILEEARHKKTLTTKDLFIIVSGEVHRDRALGTIDHHPDDYIAKPYNPGMLRQRLHRLLNLKLTLSHINEALDDEDYETAEISCLDMMKQQPATRSQCQKILGQIYNRTRNFDKAAKVYSDIIKEKSDVPWANVGLAVAELEKGNIKEAISILEDNIKSHPYYLYSYDWLEKCYLQQERSLEAQHLLSSATKLSPQAILRQMELGKVARMNNDLEVSETAYRSAVNLGEYSCFNDFDNYVQLTDCIMNNFENKSPKEQYHCAEEVKQLSKTVRKHFHNKPDYIFIADSLESKVAHMSGDSEGAMMAMLRAQRSLDKIPNPSIEHQLQLAEVYKTLGEDSYLDFMKTTLQSKEMTEAQRKQFNKVTSHQTPEENEAHSENMNAEGIKLYEQGKLKPAIESFLEAVEFEEVGLAAVLNAIQAILAHHKKTNKNSPYFQLCSKLFARIAYIDDSDARYERFTKLESQYKSYLD